MSRGETDAGGGQHCKAGDGRDDIARKGAESAHASRTDVANAGAIARRTRAGDHSSPTLS
jgi:hypothetical protein